MSDHRSLDATIERQPHEYWGIGTSSMKFDFR
jgi:hypothetical protein